MRAIIRDELLQVLATGVVALTLLGTQGVIDNYLSAILAGTNETATTSMMGAAFRKLDYLSSESGAALKEFGNASVELGREASRGVFCNMLGVGFSIVNCSPLNAFRGSLTLSAFAASTAMADSFAQQYILSLARTFSFTLIIPLGLFLRCFRVSRQAGGALIAIGFGFYAVYPTAIVATDNMLHGSPPPTRGIVPKLNEKCDPEETEVGVALNQFKRYSERLTDFGNVSQMVYFLLVRVLFNSVLSLIITLGFIRAFAHLIGSEIDVSALARIS